MPYVPSANMEDAYLISVVEKYEELYNMNHSQYSNQQRRDSIWEEIGAIMKQEGCVCKERWTRIRDNFRKALNLRRTKTGKAAIKIKAPKFKRELSFLIPFLTDEENRKLTRSGSDTEDETILSTIQNIKNMASSPSPVTITYTPAYSPDCDVQTLSSLTSKDQVTASTSVRDPGYHYSTEYDPLTDFFLTMAKTVKTFPIQEQLKVKAELFQTVNNVELRLAANESDQSAAQSTAVHSSPERSSRKTVKRERDICDNY